MSDIAISVENLSKVYLVGHDAAPERYTALRDVIARHAKNFLRKTRDMAAGRQIVQGDSVEEFWALKDVSFEVKRGEVLGVIGRNGAGKSTLLKVLSRITEPTKGRVKISGRVTSLLEVGTGFHPELTGRENIFLNGAILGMSRKEIERKFDEIVDFAEVERFLDTPVKRYSSGMYVRLAFAVAAHLDPEILIVDEVLAVGDGEFQKKCLNKMQDVAGHERTVLFVSHNMGAIASLCTNGLTLSGGKVVFLGTAEKAINAYTRSAETGCSATFAPNPNRPSIRAIHIDKDALVARDLIVDIHFESPHPLPIAVGGLGIRPISGPPIWASNGRFHTYDVQARGLNRGVLRCEATNLPIWANEFVLSAWLGDWQEDFDAKIDVLRFSLGVESADSKRPPLSLIGYVDWPAIWTGDDDAPSAGGNILSTVHERL